LVLLRRADVKILTQHRQRHIDNRRIEDVHEQPEYERSRDQVLVIDRGEQVSQGLHAWLGTASL
jgi:hypothetical protein